MRLRRCAAASEDVQVLECGQVLHLPLHPQALRTTPPLRTTTDATRLTDLVEWLRRAAAPVAGAQSRDAARLLLHLGQRHFAGTVHTGSGRSGAVMGLLQLRFWHVDVSVF